MSIFFTFQFLANSSTPSNAFDPFPLEEPPINPVQDDRFLGEFFYMLLMLGILLGLVLFASYFLKKMTSVRLESLNTTSRIKVLEHRALSQKASVHLVEIDDKEFLIAENHAGISAIELNACNDPKNSL